MLGRLEKSFADPPIRRPLQCPERGKVIEMPLVGGLHHHYLRQAA